MKLDWIIIAEGIGRDAKGALTLIGLNQNVFVAPTLPAVTKRAVVAHFVDDGDTPKSGDILSFKLSVISPSGETVSAQQGQAAIGQALWPDPTPTFDLPAEITINCAEYGSYRLEVEVQFGASQGSGGSVNLYVKEPAADGAIGSLTPSAG